MSDHELAYDSADRLARRVWEFDVSLLRDFAGGLTTTRVSVQLVGYRDESRKTPRHKYSTFNAHRRIRSSVHAHDYREHTYWSRWADVTGVMDGDYRRVRTGREAPAALPDGVLADLRAQFGNAEISIAQNEPHPYGKDRDTAA